MVSPQDWTLQPDIDPDEKPPEKEDSEDTNDAEDGDGDADDSDKDEDDNGNDKDSDSDDDEPTADDRLAALESLSEEQKATIADLRRTVGRAQSIAGRLDADKTNEELREELRNVNRRAADSMAAIVGGLDESLVDPKLREQVAATQREVERAEERADLIKSLKEEGLIQEPVEKTELEEAQEAANALGVELANQIKSFGLDPEDEAFDWKAMRDMLIAEGTAAVRSKVTATIREQITAGATEQRRETRRSTASKTPKGANAAGDEDELRTGTLDEQMQRLREMGAIQ
jgi:uncharacterized coiled-coil protein SlyX